MMDKNGNCPNCKRTWAAKEILDTVQTLDVFNHFTNNEIAKVAERYGYIPGKQQIFNSVIIHNTDKGIFLQCPYATCNHIFDAQTGEDLGNYMLLNKEEIK